MTHLSLSSGIATKTKKQFRILCHNLVRNVQKNELGKLLSTKMLYCTLVNAFKVLNIKTVEALYKMTSAAVN